MSCCPTCGQRLPIIGAVRVDLDLNIVHYRGKVAKLTPMLACLLKLLADADGAPVGRDDLLQGLYGAAIPDTEDASLKVHVHYLRKAIAPLGLRIGSHYRQGYSLWAEVQGSEVAA